MLQLVFLGFVGADKQKEPIEDLALPGQRKMSAVSLPLEGTILGLAHQSEGFFE